MGKVTKIGNGYYTDDAEYVVDGKRVSRGDGSFVNLSSNAEAHFVARALAAEQRQDSEFEWRD